MSTLLQRPGTGRPAGPAAPRADPRVGHDGGPSARSDRALALVVSALVVTACLPLTRVFVGWGFLRPVLGAALLSLALSWTCRRLGAGPLLTLLASALGWATFTGAAFLSDTLLAGVVPTASTFEAGRQMWLRGIELVGIRSAPTFAEAPLLLLAVTGVWAVAHGVDALVAYARAPLQAVAMAMMLWAVPLAVAPAGGGAWVWACPFLAAAAALVFAFAGADLERWGAWVDPWTGRSGRFRPGSKALAPAAAAVAGAAIVGGVLVADLLPGFGEPPWYRPQGLGGTTLTENPIVAIRAGLVAQDTGPIMKVRTERPVYLRTTSLDVYSADEEWTNAGIRGRPLGDRGRVPRDVDLDVGAGEHVTVDVGVENLPGAVLVPAPYQARWVNGPISRRLRYDRRVATFTLAPGTRLGRGDRYRVEATVPRPAPATLDRTFVAEDDALTALPAGVPASVGELARRIVQRAGAATPFQQALAIQDELRSWRYSLNVPAGHSGTAMEAFLTRRSGYCEQFAGTMAVMLRTLGIPARVAVGFTPGTPVGGEYVVTNANGHAWVEVLFPGQGWIAFEPTPRDDGNVLVPSMTNLAPAMTAAQQTAVNPPADGLTLEDERRALPPDPATQPEALPVPGPTEAPVGGDGRHSRVGRLLLAVLAGAGLLVAMAAGLVAGARPARADAVGRVLAARDRVTRLGRGLGVHPRGWETDREYLNRLAAGAPAAGHPANELAALAAAARYATGLPEHAATVAEQSARRLGQALLDQRPAHQRALARLRAPLITGWLAVRTRLRLRAAPPGSAKSLR